MNISANNSQSFSLSRLFMVFVLSIVFMSLTIKGCHRKDSYRFIDPLGKKPYKEISIKEYEEGDEEDDTDSCYGFDEEDEERCQKEFKENEELNRK